MKKSLLIEYEGPNSLDITLIEQSIKAIHESAGGKMIKMETASHPIKEIETIIPLLSRGGVRA